MVWSYHHAGKPVTGNMTILIEALVDSVPSALAAEAGGAGRVELCDNMIEGGTSPSAGTIAAAKARLRIPVFAMIRPRGGDFLYSDVEYDVMRRDIAHARELGADGVVLGLLDRGGAVDVERTRALVAAARPLPVTFHRAFDVARDPDEALDALVGLGVERVLTSGLAPTAMEGIALIARLVQRAAGRIGILPGCGIDDTNVQDLVGRTGVREVHVRGTSPVRSRMAFRNPRVSFRAAVDDDDSVLEVTDTGRIQAIARRLQEGVA
ncbi:MAG: copper homeostasis protein CutC [Acidobacteria bacterium]|nr:MAG: copper homeostasis protein CutC [Acidobacteriota bacterium]